MRHFNPMLRSIFTGSLIATVVVVGLLAAHVPARADSGIDVRIDIGNAPPAPHIVFRVRPHEVFVPEERVYVVDDPDVGDNDCFHYGGYYWVFREGYWYRARRWRGPFAVVHPRYVPNVFYRIPEERWKHHPHGGPPGLMKKGDERREHQGKGHGKHGDGDNRDH